MYQVLITPASESGASWSVGNDNYYPMYNRYWMSCVSYLSMLKGF